MSIFESEWEDEMADEWYYSENGTSVGPISTIEVLRRISRATARPHFVWTEGMTQWADGRDLPEFAAALRTASIQVEEPSAKHAGRSELARRARHELISYLAISAYLLIWFSALLFFKATILGSVGVTFAPFGLAVVKALILGKFILILEALKVGERRAGGTTLIMQVVNKALLFTLLLIGLTILEEIIVGHFHGHAIGEAVREIGGGTLPQALAMSVLMFLVLLPYFAFRQLALRRGDLPELLFVRQDPRDPGA